LACYASHEDKGPGEGPAAHLLLAIDRGALDG
jgi:hypothetical protein